MPLFSKPRKTTSGTPVLEKPTFYEIEIDKLKLGNYQRKLKESKVSKYTREYDPDIFGIILVSYRDGEYWIVDGQHRVEVARRKGVSTVWCQVLDGLTYEQEAIKFYLLNDSRSRLNSNNKFHAKVESGDKEACEIVEIINSYGYTYSKEGNSPDDNCINCVGSLSQIYRKQGQDILGEVLSIIRKTWNGDSSSTRQDIIKGLATFCKNYTYDKDFLIKTLEKYTPNIISNKAKAYLEIAYIRSRGTCFHITKVIRDLYDDAAIRMNGKIALISSKLG